MCLASFHLWFRHIKKDFKTQRIMKGGRIIFVPFFSSFGPIRQTDSNLHLISTINITAQSLKKRISIPSFLAPGDICVNSVARG